MSRDTNIKTTLRGETQLQNEFINPGGETNIDTVWEKQWMQNVCGTYNYYVNK